MPGFLFVIGIILALIGLIMLFVARDILSMKKKKKAFIVYAVSIMILLSSYYSFNLSNKIAYSSYEWVAEKFIEISSSTQSWSKSHQEANEFISIAAGDSASFQNIAYWFRNLMSSKSGWYIGGSRFYVSPSDLYLEKPKINIIENIISKSGDSVNYFLQIKGYASARTKESKWWEEYGETELKVKMTMILKNERWYVNKIDTAFVVYTGVF